MVVANAAHYRELFTDHTARILRYLAEAVRRTDNRPLPLLMQERAVHVLRYALRQPAVWAQTGAFVVALAPKLEMAGHRQGWVELLESAVQRSREEKDTPTTAVLLYHLGILHRLQARYPEAEQAFGVSAGLYAQEGDAVAVAQVHSRHAYLAWTQRDFVRARRLVQEAQTRLPQEREATDTHAYCHLVLGALAFEEGAWQQAHDEFQVARHLWQQTGEPRMAAVALSNQALALQWAGRNAEALPCYREALDQLERIGDTTGWAVAQMNLGSLYRVQGKPEQALACHRQAEQVFRKTDDQLRLARVYNNEGEVYRDLEQWTEAERAYRLSLERWRTVGNVSGMVNTLDNLAAVLIAQERHDEAIEILEDALHTLAEMADDPARPRLLRTVTEKLAQAQRLQADRRSDGPCTGRRSSRIA